ncbi:MAG: secretin N-terminal domain-containing protein [Candidatus Omnitrophica bacterium]|nr:secretin N-terminal domain-containing protein [Candidatus Omnitrophota bacterium]
MRLLICFFLYSGLFLFYPGLILSEDEAMQASAVEEAYLNEVNDNDPKYSDKISLDLKGVDINELFKIISARTGITIVTSPEVKGRVSVFIDNLSFDDALDVIVTLQNLAYERKGNVVKVMTTVEYEKAYGKKFGERKETRTIRLTYAKPSNVVNVITSLKSDLGKIVADEATGTIIITDTPQSMNTILEAIKELDSPLETLVFDINYARFGDMKNYLSELITPGVGQIISDDRSGKVVIYDFPQRLVRIKKLLQELDEQSRQVLITGEIIEVEIDDKFQSGIEWEKIFKSVHMDNLDLVTKFPVTPALANYGKISVGTLTQDHYNIIINMISEYGKTKIINRPRIVAVNREEAKILVGTREAYVTSSQSQGETSVVTAESINFIDVGVKLIVVPTIGSDGFITMKIKPEISSVKEYLDTEAGSRVPIVKTAESETVVKVKDGSMLVIAGLMIDNDAKETKGLPGLSKMPILGHFFSARTKEKTKSELVIFITPTIISGISNAGREERDAIK